MPPYRPPRSRHFLVLPPVDTAAVDIVAVVVEAVAADHRHCIQGYLLQVVVVVVGPTVAQEVDLLVEGLVAAVVGHTADWTTY